MVRFIMRVWALLCFCGAVSPGYAAVVEALSVGELTRAASHVVRGRVHDLGAAFSEDGRTIVTTIELRVTERFKGQTPEVVSIRTPGGVVGAIGQHVPGAASFVKNEEVIVFLEPAAAGRQTYMVVGLSLGKFSLVTGTGGEQPARRDLGQLTLAGDRQPSEVPALIEPAELLRAIRQEVGRRDRP